MKNLLLLFILGLCLSNLSFAQSSRPIDSSGMSTEDKIELIKDIKKFIHDFEQDNQIQNLTLHDQRKYFSFFLEEAWANDTFDCFYGGWPSHLQSVGEKKYCSNPKKSELYHQSNCKPNELACEPILFGGGVCAPFSTKPEKLAAFSNCEKKFEEKPEKDKYKFVKNLAGEELNRLKLYLEIVSKTCNVNQHNFKTVAYNCKKINDKIAKFYSHQAPKKDKVHTIVSSTKQINNLDCIDCGLKTTPTLSTGNLNELTKSLNPEKQNPTKEAYDKLKKDYIDSGMCDPTYNYTGEDKAALLLSSMSKKTSTFYPWFDKDYKADVINNSFNTLIKSLDLSGEEKSDLSNEFKKLQGMNYYLNYPNVNEKYRLREPYYKQAKKLVAKFKVYALKSLERNKHSGEQIIHEQMANKKIVKLLPNGELDCSFMDYSLFEKAFKGFNELKSGLKKPLLTIVDYTQPSNSRRMFVLDMNKNMVLNNTWVAHGNGPDNDQDRGEDGWGANPVISNKSGTNLSSHGFIKTGENYVGEYGPSIRLNGVDSENGNMRSRAVVIHPWDSQPLTSPNDEYQSETLKLLQDINFDDDQTVAKAAEAFRNIPEGDYIPATWGCLGVSNRSVPDRLTNKSIKEIDLLRRDVAGGTLIFNYSGPDQKSKYF